MALKVEQLITEHLDLWTQAQTAKSTSGRGSNNKIELTGIKKLRELILELAVRGKLVPQDPNDEPASELLKRMIDEKESLIKAKIIRKSKDLAPVATDEIPYEIPNGWSTTRLGSIGDWGAGATPSRARSEYYGGAIPWFKSGELTADFIDFSEEKITSLALKDCSLRLNKVGDVLIAMYGATIGKASILSVEGTTNQAVCACTPFGCITNVYLLTLLKAYKHRFVSMGAGGAQPNISREKIIATPILLPPLSEQNRIVSKVDDLMALCDQLEQQSYQQLDAHNQLVEALLATLTQSQNADELASNWQRLAAHFDTLFTTEYSIDALKQTILQLAVMGKLVKQDPNDEPAIELLKSIAAEKDALVKAGKIKKQKPLPPISDDEKPFELPQGWACERIGTFAFVGTGATPARDNPAYWFPKEVNWVSSGETSQQFIFETKEKVSLLALKETNVSVYPVGTLIVAMYGQGKTRGQITELKIEAGTNQACAAIELIEKSEWHKDFVKLFFQKSYSELRELAAGGAQPNLNVGKIAETVAPIPPLNEQKKIVIKVTELIKMCDLLYEALERKNLKMAVLAEVLVEQVVA